MLLNKNENVSVVMITNKKTNKLMEEDIAKFNKQYPQLTIKYSDDFHDGFIIIDRNKIYHLGDSLKDLGNKAFGVNEMNDKSLPAKLDSF